MVFYMLQGIKKFIKSMTKEDVFIMSVAILIGVLYDIGMWIYFKY